MDNRRQTFFTITCFSQMVLAAVVALPSCLRKVPKTTFTRDRTNSRPYSNSSGYSCSHETGQITGQKVFTRSRTNSCPKLFTKLVVVVILAAFFSMRRCRDIIAICETEICTSPTIEDSSRRITTAKKPFFHSFLIIIKKCFTY